VSGTIAQDPGDGLRARKRAATAAAIERATLDLALEHGYDNVTVEMICAASSVSPRTFFNYFGSKEGAVLGPIGPEPTDGERTAFLESSSVDVLTDLVAMLATVITGRSQDRGAFAARRAIVIANPGLLRKQVDRMGELESRLLDLVLERFARQGRSGGLEDEARMVVTMAGAVLRFSARRWFESDDPLDLVPMLQEHLALARRVIRTGA
jgi:AcrR family transcriptional regulator